MKSTIAFLLVILSLGTTYAQTTSVGDLGSRIQKILDKHQVPGAGVALVHRDSIVWTGTLGLADRRANRLVTRRTLFGIGSLAKTFLAMTALAAQEQGKLAIDDPIVRMVPSLPLTNAWKMTDPVRLIHLLEHTSGFDEAHLNLAIQTNSRTPLRQVVDASQHSLVTRWKPGQYYAYNNLGAMVATYVIEEGINEPFENFVQRNIFEPLGMTRATYHPDERSNLAKGYRGASYAEETFPDLPQWPAGGLVASVEDMANMVRTLLNGGKFKEQQILAPSSVSRMETPETSLRAKQGIHYGYGKGLTIKSERGHLFCGHGGRYGGFLSEFGYTRDLNRGYVILLNNVDGRKAQKEIRQLLLDYIIPEELGETEAGPAETVQPPGTIAGCYQPITPAMDITQFVMRLIDLQFVAEENGQWYQKSIFGNRQRLLPVNETQFRRADEPVATSVFVKGQDGGWQWLDEVAYQQIPAWWGYAQFWVAAGCLLTVLLAFVTLLVWVPVRLIRRKKYTLLSALPLMAIIFFIGMVISLEVATDSLQSFTFTLGAGLFLIFGWGFLALSFAGLVCSFRAIYWKRAVSSWVKYYTLFVSLVCCTVSVYLLYWNVIGLTLWNY